ncbi:MAG: hypothetical protein KJ621_14340 [Proteobacteria bacterium]|nr:hypothetical protein [Pseudomonadota bacterium]MBU1741961.1 hypothetical protein [Pseudomonadota bacterium]
MNKGIKGLSAVLLAGSLFAALTTAGIARTTGPVPTTRQCVTVGRVFVLVLGQVGSRSGPFYRAFVQDKDCLAVIRHSISRGGKLYVAQVKALKACRTAIVIAKRYFTGGRRIDPTRKPGTRRSFYSPWKPIRKINVTVAKGSCPR